MPNTTGRPGCRTMEGGSSASYLARTPRVPLFCTLTSGGGNRRALDNQGRAGIISIIQWNLCQAIFGVERKLPRASRSGIRNLAQKGLPPRLGNPQMWERHVGFGGTARMHKGPCTKQCAWRKRGSCDMRLAKHALLSSETL